MHHYDLTGETTEYEKKQALEVKRPKSWLKSVSAFANTFGGRIIFGVADNDEVVGLTDARRDAALISELIKAHLEPLPVFKLSFEQRVGKDLIVVDVRSGTQTPYYYSGDGQLTAFVRLGNESVMANAQQLRELVIQGSGSSYDSLPCPYLFEDMAFSKLRSVYRQQTGSSFEEKDFESFGIVDHSRKLTYAGALLADESPIRQSRVFCTRWQGLNKASGLEGALDDAEYNGSLLELFQNSLGFIMRHNRKGWRKRATDRVEYPDYPQRAVTEGLVNALIHRNYLNIGSEVHVDIYDDRLEIYSPGGMVDGSTLEGVDLTSVPSQRRNPVLADIFGRLKLMERRGSGFRKILEDYEFQERMSAALKPVFTADSRKFVLTLYNLNYPKSQADAQADAQERESGRYESRILELIGRNRNITRAELAQMLDVSKKTIERQIKNIKNLSYVGSGYSGHWEIRGS